MSYLLTALTFSLSLALSARPPVTTAVAYDLTEFRVEDGLIHFKEAASRLIRLSMAKFGSSRITKASSLKPRRAISFC